MPERYKDREEEVRTKSTLKQRGGDSEIRIKKDRDRQVEARREVRRGGDVGIGGGLRMERRREEGRKIGKV